MIQDSTVPQNCDKQVKNRPDNTAFKQQSLPAWQPVYTAKSILPVFLVISILFTSIGVVLLMTSRQVTEHSYDYTECHMVDNASQLCSTFRENTSLSQQQCICSLTISVDELLGGNVYFYYGLENFFQNHRRYLKSRDDNQLVGNSVDTTGNSDCAPYNEYKINGNSYSIAPCGAIANSMFNDTFTVYYSAAETMQVPILRTGIAWHSDKSAKFNNPSPTNNLIEAFQNSEKPFYWQIPIYYLDNDTMSNNGYENEAFIVWMRTAAFPKFRKLFGRLDRQQSTFEAGLPAGNYTVQVNYNYPVALFGGKKRFIVSNTSWMGGRNDFLGIAYICCGALCAVLLLVLLSVHFVGKKLHIINVQPIS